MIDNIKAIIDLKGKCQSVIKWRLTDACNYRCPYCVRSMWIPKDRNVIQVEEDNKVVISLIPEIARIINEMPGKVKLDLIGGEISLLDLETILNGIFSITSNKLFRLNITTNMFRSAEYYTNLCNICYNNGAELGITCSWHSDFCSFENFFEKFEKIKSPTNQKGIRAECVSRVDNQEDIKRFIDYCESKGLSYFVERDLNATPEEKRNLMIGSSSKKKDRYKIITDSDQENLLKTRNEFISGEKANYECYISSKNYYCSRDYDYVYLDKDKHMGRIGDTNDCKNVQPISEFHPLKEPKICGRDACTLCGHISLSTNIEYIMYKGDNNE